jgi:predicted PurR-regulated permease PerM
VLSQILEHDRDSMPTDDSDKPTPSTPTPSINPASTSLTNESRDALVEIEAVRGEQRALTWAALLAVAAIVWIVLPVGVGILFGMLLAFTAQPLFERLTPRIGSRWSALATVILSTLVLTASLGGLAWLVVAKGTVLTKTLIASIGSGGPITALLNAAGRLTRRIGIPPEELATRARALAETAAVRASEVAEVLVSATASAALGLFFAMLSMHFTLRNWQSLALRAQRSFPLRPDYTAELFAEFRRVGRTTLLGTVLTGLAQGVLGGIGFWITGLPDPIFFGAATAVASLLPAVGTMLVWIPAGIALIASGSPGRGVLELCWGFMIVVGVSDYVIRPRLVAGEAEVPALVTFTALFGGVEVLGLKGLIVGPVLMSVALAVLRSYAEEARKRHSHAAGAVAAVV